MLCVLAVSAKELVSSFAPSLRANIHMPTASITAFWIKSTRSAKKNNVADFEKHLFVVLGFQRLTPAGVRAIVFSRNHLKNMMLVDPVWDGSIV